MNEEKPLVVRDERGRLQKGSKLNYRGNKGIRLAEHLEKLAQQIPENAPKRKKRGELLAELVWKKALEGDKMCIELIYNRIDGKPKQEIAVDNITPQEITVVVTANEDIST